VGEHVKVQELPGIGKRYDIGCGVPGQRLSVVVHKDGRRELYSFEKSGDEPTSVIELTDQQARMLGAVLTGTYFSD
jgi:TrkA domain protein